MKNKTRIDVLILAEKLSEYDDIDVFFSFAGHIQSYQIYVNFLSDYERKGGQRRVYDVTYSKQHPQFNEKTFTQIWHELNGFYEFYKGVQDDEREAG